MEGLWRSFSHRRQDGHCHQPHPYVVHVHFITHTRLSHCDLHDPCVLDEYETLYEGPKEKSNLEPLDFGFVILDLTTN